MEELNQVGPIRKYINIADLQCEKLYEIMHAEYKNTQYGRAVLITTENVLITLAELRLKLYPD